MEDYEKKYKEALLRAKSMSRYPNQHCFVDITEIFPELKQSEDETIRKELISFVKNDGWKFTKLTKEKKRILDCLA